MTSQLLCLAVFLSEAVNARSCRTHLGGVEGGSQEPGRPRRTNGVVLAGFSQKKRNFFGDLRTVVHRNDSVSLRKIFVSRHTINQ